MDINFLKLGFKSYLEGLNKTEDKNYKVSNSDVSIFMYANEFKDYIQDEINVSADIMSMSINDILDMEVKNGKLVEAEEAGLDTFESTTKTEPAEGTQVPAQTSAPVAAEAAQTGEVTTAQVPISAQDAEMPVANEQTTIPVEGNETQTEEYVAGEDFITDVINTLLQEEDIIEVLDTDKSGELNEEEVDVFLNAIKEFDGDAENISFEDIIGSLEAMQKGELNLNAEETQNKAEDKTEVEETNNTSNTNAAQATSNSGSNGVRRSSGSSNSGSTNKSNNTPKSYSEMTESELNTELDKKETELAAKQESLSAVYSGTAPEMAKLKEAEDAAYQNYLDAVANVDEKLAEELDLCKTAVDDQQKLVDEKDLEISNQESAISDAESAHKNATSVKNNLESSLSSLQSALSGASDEEKANINSKIASVKEQLSTAEAAEADAKTAEEEAKEKLEALKEEKTELETELTARQEALAAKEQEIATAYPEIAELQKAYNEAKTDYAETKEKMISALQEEISSIEAAKNEIKAELTNRVNKAATKENSLSAFSQYDAEKGQRILDAAQSLYGNNTKSGGYCGAGVSNSLYKALGYRMSGDGYMWGDVLEDCDDFVEVTDEVTLDDLDDLPAGAVISWSKYEAGHTNSDGKYGHVCIADGNGGEISDYARENINIKFGSEWGGTFRVFIPA